LTYSLLALDVSAINMVVSYILPRASEELWVRRMALGGNLDQKSAGEVSAGAQRKRTDADAPVK
jgi:hypothetical protein